MSPDVFSWKFLVYLNSADTKNPYRWVLLRHTGSPDDIRGIHFDLLLEDKDFCRTWRLTDIPLLNGPYVNSVYISPHHLDWLDIEEKVVSGNRGLATRIKKGIFWESLPSLENSFINLWLKWEDVEVELVIDANGCKLFSNKSNYF